MSANLIAEAKEIIDDIIDPIESIAAKATAAAAKLESVPVVGEAARELKELAAGLSAKLTEVREKLGISDDIGGDPD